MKNRLFMCASAAVWLAAAPALTQNANADRELISTVKATLDYASTYVGKPGLIYYAGASAETVDAQKVCMNNLPMPTGAVAKAN